MFIFLGGILVSTLITFISTSIFFWWGSFLLSTMVFLSFSKSSFSPSSFLIFFIVQEVSGLFFLISSGFNLQFLFLLLKSGVSPFFFWMSGVVFSLSANSIFWFLTVQKFPYLSPISFCFQYGFFFVVLFSLPFLYFEIFIIKSFSLMLLLSSVETFSWLSLYLPLDFFSGVFLFSLYSFSLWLGFDSFAETFRSTGSFFVGYWMMGFPFGVPFMLKWFMAGTFLDSGSSLLFGLLCLFSLMMWGISFFLVSLITSSSGFMKESWMFLLSVFILFLV